MKLGPMNNENTPYKLILEDGTLLSGYPFGYPKPVAGEVVFNTGMVGYPETLTDPSYYGQILVLTYPIIGNYGVPGNGFENNSISSHFESTKIQITGLIVSEAVSRHNHWNALQSLDQWLKGQRIPALAGIDTRALTKILRDKGSMLGKLCAHNSDAEFYDPNQTNLVSQVSIPTPEIFERHGKTVVVIDCGCKHGIIRNLINRDLTVIRVPWNYDFLDERFDGVLISNGPGDPKMCTDTISIVQRVMERGLPICGICLGNQILALAAGADTYKLKFGHRSQNQPCIKVGTRKCYITSQNHGYAVSDRHLPAGWEPWFLNANDHTNEGIRHRSKPFFSVQFHPEATPGPIDTNFIFDEFISAL
jgi:carbamoyl-phosphate synthase small subunit